MATRIRLQRMGAKKKPFYRVVVAESVNAPTGKIIDRLGTYNPHTDPPEIKIDLEKTDEWLAKGAQPSPKTSIILKKAKNQTSKAE